MQHSIVQECFGVRLRPVAVEDAAFIVKLRCSAHARGNVGDTSSDQELQERWIQNYLRTPDDYYFIIETKGGIAVGTVGLYNFHRASAEAGRWLILPGVLAALPSTLAIGNVAFDQLGLASLRQKIVSTNEKVISFHRRFGMREIGIESGGATIGGRTVDLVTFELAATDWPKLRDRHAKLAAYASSALA